MSENCPKVTETTGNCWENVSEKTNYC